MTKDELKIAIEGLVAQTSFIEAIFALSEIADDFERAAAEARLKASKKSFNMASRKLVALAEKLSDL